VGPLVFVDADDTLWENNRYFTAVLDEWAQLMARLGTDPVRALAVLEAEEDRSIPVHGYGAVPFAASLHRAFGDLVPRAPAAVRSTLRAFAERAEASIRDHPIDLLPGVAEGLERLAERARVVVLTKGQDEEQRAKVARSGLGRYLTAVRVVVEKSVRTYAEAAARFDAQPGACWMVGNSPRSDVNPARRAGLRTVYVPHPAPWHRDLEPLLEEGPECHVATTFADVPGLILRRR
jgi:putative hydrolase of the HAD superfamily